MREIKLRVWDSDNGMHYLNVEEMDDSLTFRSLRHFDGDLTVMQYTGVEDKNGREIYEGDIVEYVNLEAEPVIIGKVEFDFGQWSVRCLETDIGYNLYGISDKNLRVVGNIYEGKQLSMEDIFAAIKEITYDAVKEMAKGSSGDLSKWEFLDSLGVDVTVYDRTEINVTEFSDGSKLYLFNESVTGKYDVIAQIDKDKFLHITDEQKEKLNELQR